jgi:hypothetical protein
VRLVETGSPIVRKLGSDRACRVAFGRFPGNRAVTPEQVVAVMQLVEGRSAGPEHRAGERIAPDEQAFAVVLNQTLEGKTKLQKNPHQEGSLAWLAWIVGRLGGWSGYQRYGPAGPKTIACGWDQFKTMSQGWNLRQNV